MSRGVKITLIVVGVVVLLLVVGVVGIGFYFYQSTQKVAAEAKAFAAQSDQAGCLKEAMSRQKENDSPFNLASSGAFLAVCLEGSKPTAGFCDGVPPSSDQQQTVQWVKARCQSSGLTEVTCTALMTIAQKHCEGGTRKR